LTVWGRRATRNSAGRSAGARNVIQFGTTRAGSHHGAGTSGKNTVCRNYIRHPTERPTAHSGTLSWWEGGEENHGRTDSVGRKTKHGAYLTKGPRFTAGQSTGQARSRFRRGGRHVRVVPANASLPSGNGRPGRSRRGSIPGPNTVLGGHAETLVFHTRFGPKTPNQSFRPSIMHLVPPNGVLPPGERFQV